MQRGTRYVFRSMIPATDYVSIKKPIGQVVIRPNANFNGILGLRADLSQSATHISRRKMEPKNNDEQGVEELRHRSCAHYPTSRRHRGPRFCPQTASATFPPVQSKPRR